jgi:hypothetical protein
MTEKQAELAVERWEAMTEAERLAIRKEIGVGMRSYWSSLTPEQRSAIGKKAAETRKRNKLAKARGETL